jgi:hypothetical protein
LFSFVNSFQADYKFVFKVSNKANNLSTSDGSTYSTKDNLANEANTAEYTLVLPR